MPSNDKRQRTARRTSEATEIKETHFRISSDAAGRKAAASALKDEGITTINKLWYRITIGRLALVT